MVCKACQTRPVKNKSHNSPRRASPPSYSPRSATVVVPAQRERGSIVRDAAAVAGGVAVGTTAGHLAGEAISGLFGGRSREREMSSALPRDYTPGADPSGPCAYEIAQFMNCASLNEDLGACAQYRDMLLDCKRRNRLP